LSNANIIKQIGHELGFQQVGICDTRLDRQHAHYGEWIARHYHGEMGYMARNLDKRLNPRQLVPDTLSVICVRLDYLVREQQDPLDLLDHADLAYLSRYALGRDYHKLMRRRLQQLADQIAAAHGSFGYRAFVDSAPVLEKPLARNAGLGWIGKHTNLLNRDAGSWFFLGELLTDLPLPVDAPATEHCGSCTACIDVCPTDAIIGPFQLDARRCISYLTIELKGSIPEEYRPLIGNRVYGCDDCQAVCPWNSFARPSAEPDFAVRNGLDTATLVELFAWTEPEFEARMRGSAIRRIGHERWLRNLAVGLGNAPGSVDVVAALRARAAHPSAMVREHVRWALARQAAAGA